MRRTTFSLTPRRMASSVFGMPRSRIARCNAIFGTRHRGIDIAMAGAYWFRWCEFLRMAMRCARELALVRKTASRRRGFVSREKIQNKLAELHEFRKLAWLAEIPVCAESV